MYNVPRLYSAVFAVFAEGFNHHEGRHSHEHCGQGFVFMQSELGNLAGYIITSNSVIDAISQFRDSNSLESITTKAVFFDGQDWKELFFDQYDQIERLNSDISIVSLDFTQWTLQKKTLPDLMQRLRREYSQTNVVDEEEASIYYHQWNPSRTHMVQCNLNRKVHPSGHSHGEFWFSPQPLRDESNHDESNDDQEVPPEAIGCPILNDKGEVLGILLDFEGPDASGNARCLHIHGIVNAIVLHKMHSKAQSQSKS